MIHMSEDELKAYVDKAVQDALVASITKKANPRLLTPTLEKWFRDEGGSASTSKMGKAFGGNGVVTYSIWDAVRPVVTKICGASSVRHIAIADEEIANRIADRICTVIYECRQEYVEHRKEREAHE